MSFPRLLRQMSTIQRPPNPLIAIVGATGTGKSDLAVDLAEKFNGEIVNGDALQLYEGLPVTTNKIPVSERRDIPHHLLGIIPHDCPTWNVSKYTMEASRTLDDIYAKAKTPILVGGTSYYVQSLLFSGQTVVTSEDGGHVDYATQNQRWAILDGTGSEMLEVLKDVDPEMASRWHPNDKRKIRRSLEIWLQTGQKASEIYREQKMEVSPGDEPECNRRYDAVVFWLHSDRDVLSKRTSARLERMMSGGLLPEIHYMYGLYKASVRSGSPIDKSRGLWIAIGYKEFEDYLKAAENGETESRLEALRSQALERAQITTRQYAKSQERWIRLKLLPRMRSIADGSRLFLLDSTNLAEWPTNVIDKAHTVTKLFLKGDSLPQPEELSAVANRILGNAKEDEVHDNKSQHCDICGTTCTTARTWQQHLSSKRHRKLSSAAKNERPTTANKERS